VLDYLPGTPFLAAGCFHIPEPTTTSPEIEARFLNLQRQAIEAVQLLPQAPPELVNALQSATSPAALADLTTSYLDIKAAGQAGDPGDHRPLGSNGKSLAASGRAARGAAADA